MPGGGGQICSHPQRAVWAKGPGPGAKLDRTRDLERHPQGTGGALPQIKYKRGGAPISVLSPSHASRQRPSQVWQSLSQAQPSPRTWLFLSLVRNSVIHKHRQNHTRPAHTKGGTYAGGPGNSGTGRRAANSKGRGGG